MKTLIFVNMKAVANDLLGRLYNAGFVVAGVHGDISQAGRERSLEAFRSGLCTVLIATDVSCLFVCCKIRRSYELYNTCGAVMYCRYMTCCRLQHVV